MDFTAILYGETISRDELARPDWETGGRVHNWKNHVPAELKCIWTTLPLVAQIVVFIMAVQASDAEEWD